MTKKTLFTLNIDNYAPEVTKISYPILQAYAKRIGADFYIINKRKYPDYPIYYEKMQIYELGLRNDWNIYVDSDVIIHQEFFDLTEFLSRDTIMCYSADFAPGIFKYDEYFRRDGRNVAVPSFMVASSDLCHDIWEPITDLTRDEALSRIYYTGNEKKIGYSKNYGIDDFAISRNMAKYGIKFNTAKDLLRMADIIFQDFIFHNFGVSNKEKVTSLKAKIKEWAY